MCGGCVGLDLAGQASAATQLGLDFTPEDSTKEGGTTCGGGTGFFPLANNTTPEPYRAPAAGVITSWSFTTGRHAFTDFKFKVVRFTGNDGLTVASDTATLPANQRTTNNVRIAVRTGDRIGFFIPSSGDCLLRSTGATLHLIGSDTQPGQSNTYGAAAAGFIFPVSARLEADADNDGFGDESQDKCPTDARTQGACPSQGPGTPANPVIAPPGGTDSIKPTLGGLSFSSTVFKAASSGPAFSAQRPIGTRVFVHAVRAERGQVHRPAQDQRPPGLAQVQDPHRKNRTKPKCTLWKNVTGSFTVPGKTGANTFTFRGRIGGKKLRPASYRLNGTATDPAKNKSLPKRKGFRIVK